jgi:ABC-type transporter Mla MlaB component
VTGGRNARLSALRSLQYDVSALTEPDAGTVEELARLQLAARRRGCRLELVGATPRLQELLQLTGLADVLALAAGRRDVLGQPEQREQPLGVEEGIDPDDPPG